MKKIGGILLIIIGVILVFIAFGQLNKLISNVLGIIKLFYSNVSSYEKGQISAGIIYWLIHFLITYFAFKFGSKLTKKESIEG